MKVDFLLRYHTQFGQTIALTANQPVGGEPANSEIPLQFLNDQFWTLSLELDPASHSVFNYSYILITQGGERRKEAEKDRTIDLTKINDDLLLIDCWNDESFYENSFFTTPFTDVFFRDHARVKFKKPDQYTHQFKVKAPLLGHNECICISGSIHELNNWDTTQPLLLHKKGDWWTISLDLSITNFPFSYKFGIYNIKKDEFVRFEDGDNRILNSNGNSKRTTILHEGFVRLPNNTFRGTGVAIPVFSLRTSNSFGIGEFTDIKYLVDWANETGLKLIQLLPINDTSATFTWKDSYPYAAISAFALHPIYISLQKVAGKKHAHLIKSLAKKQKQLNLLAEIDYEQVMLFKLNTLKELYDLDQMQFLKEEEYRTFFNDNKSWLIPYAAFCFFRDKFGTADYSKWRTNATYNQSEIEKLSAARSKQATQIAFHYFVQYHLHLQLKEAADYAHKNGIAFKGDIPIGIYRYGCDAWTAPEMYNMHLQAGAPPDDFAVKGQNWGFPTYNWKKMAEDHFEWWRQRFHQMSNYFDAFRIDHILGFFRIWSIPIDAVEGIMGRFMPAIPVSAQEFGEKGIWFDYKRYCKPFINDAILDQLFNDKASEVKETYLLPAEHGGYDLKPEFSTQVLVQEYFDVTGGDQEIKQGLFDLISNVILFEEEGSDKQLFHFRISIESTPSFQQFDEATKTKVRELYINYFYRRQDDFWKSEAMQKLPALKSATNMLICGEDLGMVPHSVPEVMQQLSILSLEIQRMPKNPSLEFFHPKDAPYLSVVTPSSHDMSTIRGWWEENREKTQRFFNAILGENGYAPYFCEPWINRAIVLQHLYAPAMWSIFQLQDILGMSEELRRNNPAEERINNPANANHYWNYRMHIPLEKLLKEKAFNHELKDYITNSGRA